MIIKVILGIINLLIVPELLGFLITKFTKEKNNIFFAFVQGYLLEFVSFELLYVPMYFARLSFKVVFYSWTVLILILSIISVIVNRKRWKEIMNATIENFKGIPRMLTVVFLVFLMFQIIMSAFYVQNIDLDDSFYVGTMLTTIETNSLFEYDAYDGSKYTMLPLRYSLSGLVIYFAALSESLRIHPAILAHTIWPIIAILLEFIIYGLIGKEILKKDKEKIVYFLIFLSVIYIFGYVSVFFNFSYFAYRSSQGKALLGNLMIPTAWLCYFYCIQNNKFIDWLLLFFASMASCFVTEMGIFLTPLVIGTLAILDFVQNRKFLNLLKFGICCLPQLIIGTLYLILI